MNESKGARDNVGERGKRLEDVRKRWNSEIVTSDRLVRMGPGYLSTTAELDNKSSNVSLTLLSQLLCAEC